MRGRIAKLSTLGSVKKELEETIARFLAGSGQMNPHVDAEDWW
jgi:hypothetical protein